MCIHNIYTYTERKNIYFLFVSLFLVLSRSQYFTKKYFLNNELSYNEILVCFWKVQSLHYHKLLCIISTIISHFYNPNKSKCSKPFPHFLLSVHLPFIQDLDLCSSTPKKFCYLGKDHLEAMIQIRLTILLV